jgi:hypothetical protein
MSALKRPLGRAWETAHCMRVWRFGRPRLVDRGDGCSSHAIGDWCVPAGPGPLPRSRSPRVESIDSARFHGCCQFDRFKEEII